MELQRREQQASPAPSPGQPAAPYAPGAGGGGPDPVPGWLARPPLPASKNPLLGRWRVAGVDTGKPTPLASLFGPEMAAMERQMKASIHGSVCSTYFGDSAVEFGPKAFVNLGADGRGRGSTAVVYRTDGHGFAVLPTDPALHGVFVFDLRGDRAVARVLGCTLQRVSAGGTTASAGEGRSRDARAGNEPVATGKVAAGEAMLDVSASVEAGSGTRVPLAGVTVFLLTRSLDEALGSVGLREPTPLRAWLQACQARAPACRQAMQAMVANPAAKGKTDARGHVELAQLAAGRYYVLSIVAAGNDRLIWDVPVDVKAGANAVSLGRHNAIRPPG